MEEKQTPLIYTALVAVNREVEAIKKGRKNKEQGYSFRGIDDAYNELHDLFAKHGIIVLPKYLDSYREERKTKSGSTLIYSVATYEFTFLAEDGSREKITLQGEGMDTGDKSLNKAFSASLKYALFSMFLIPTDEIKDSENESHEVMPKEITVQPAAEQKPISEKAFAQLCEKLKANSNPQDRGNLLAKTRRYYLPMTNEQEMTIKEITDNI